MSDLSETAPRRGPHRVLFNWVMSHADGPYAWWFLAGVAFAESSFFPIPPDVMLVPMALAKRERSFAIAAWATLWSVIGGTVGYGIGHLLYDSVGQWLITAYGYGDNLEMFRSAYAKWGAWIILIKGVTPIPYKLVAIASGFAGFSLPLFILLSIVTRGARFSLVTGLIYIFGDKARDFIDKRLEYVMAGLLVLIVSGFVIVHYVA